MLNTMCILFLSTTEIYSNRKKSAPSANPPLDDFKSQRCKKRKKSISRGKNKHRSRLHIDENLLQQANQF